MGPKKSIFPATLALICAVVLVFSNCQHRVDIEPPGTTPDPVIVETPCDPDVVYFVQDVLPLLVSSCGQATCHDAITHEKGIIIESYESIMNSNDFVVAGNAGESEMIEVLFETGDDFMPPAPNAPLTNEQVNTLINWVNQGALNLSCSACDTASVTFSGNLFPLISNACLACHSGASPNGGVNLSTHGGVSGAVAYSNLMACIRQEPGVEAMPPAGNPLSDCQVRMFEIWIEEGMPNN